MGIVNIVNCINKRNFALAKSLDKVATLFFSQMLKPEVDVDYIYRLSFPAGYIFVIFIPPLFF